MTYHTCHELPFDQINIVDTEFFGDDGDQKTPVCLVVRELLSGEVRRYWMDELLILIETMEIVKNLNFLVKLLTHILYLVTLKNVENMTLNYLLTHLICLV